MTTPDETSERPTSNTHEAAGGKRRLILLIGLLAIALFALWYDYKVARPAVERAYDLVAAKNDEINSASEHRLMTNKDVQSALNRTPSETFPHGEFTIEAYRWIAGMPLKLRGLKAEETPGIGFKTHDYYAVYRQEGTQLSFVTHFKIDLDPEYFREKESVAGNESPLMSMGDPASGPEMGGGPASGPGFGGPPGPGGGGPGGGFDPEAFFADRDVDGDGKLTGEEISERMRGRLEEIDTDKDGAVSKEEFLAGRPRGGAGGPGGPGGGGPGRGGPGGGEGRQQRPPLESGDAPPAAEATPSDAPPAAEPKEATPAESAPEKPEAEAAAGPAAEAAPQPSEEAAKEESGSES